MSPYRFGKILSNFKGKLTCFFFVIEQKKIKTNRQRNKTFLFFTRKQFHTKNVTRNVFLTLDDLRGGPQERKTLKGAPRKLIEPNLMRQF